MIGAILLKGSSNKIKLESANNSSFTCRYFSSPPDSSLILFPNKFCMKSSSQNSLLFALFIKRPIAFFTDNADGMKLSCGR